VVLNNSLSLSALGRQRQKQADNGVYSTELWKSTHGLGAAEAEAEVEVEVEAEAVTDEGNRAL
jgi:hypothetical protein